jgi:hypothetical protein
MVVSCFRGSDFRPHHERLQWHEGGGRIASHEGLVPALVHTDSRFYLLGIAADQECSFGIVPGSRANRKSFRVRRLVVGSRDLSVHLPV